MSLLDYVVRSCPYCNEPLELSLDPSVDQQSYVEDCQGVLFAVCRDGRPDGR